MNELNTIELIVKIVNFMLCVSYHTHTQKEIHTHFHLEQMIALWQRQREIPTQAASKVYEVLGGPWQKC